jgi:hypothetical protein
VSLSAAPRRGEVQNSYHPPISGIHEGVDLVKRRVFAFFWGSGALWRPTAWSADQGWVVRFRGWWCSLVGGDTVVAGSCPDVG